MDLLFTVATVLEGISHGDTEGAVVSYFLTQTVAGGGHGRHC